MFIQPKLEKIGYAGAIRVLSHLSRIGDMKEDSFYKSFEFIKNDLAAPESVVTLDEKIKIFGATWNRFYDFESGTENHKYWNKVTRVQDGVYIAEELNIEHDLDYIKCSFDDLKTKTDLSYRYMNTYPGQSNEKDASRYIPFSYGVCDNAADILNYDISKYYDEDYYDDEDRARLLSELPYKTLGELLEKSDRQYAIFMVKMSQEEQPDCGGWRWHKWGPYIGKHNVSCEYLYDEDMSDIGQNFVYVFHIYEFLDGENTKNKLDFSDEFSNRVCKQFLIDGLNLNKFTNEVSFKDVDATEYHLIALQEYVSESFARYDVEFKLNTDMSIKFVCEKLNEAYKADWAKAREAKEAAEKAEREANESVENKNE